MRTTFRLLFNPQHRTPILPQLPVVLPKDDKKVIRVGYLLSRNPIVKPEPHPLETEMGFMLQREHARYARHEADSLTAFMASRDQTIDAWGRSDPNQTISNYFGLEMYQDSMKTVLNRYKPLPRTVANDFVDIMAEQKLSALPTRHSIQRCLGDYLFLITKDATTGLWGVPSVEREPHETLRMTLDRSVNDHHKGSLDTYTFSNAPQAVLTTYPDYKPTNEDLEKAKQAQNSSADEKKGKQVKTFIYNVVYLAGRPDFEGMGCSDHAWVTRNELMQYYGSFSDPRLGSILRDIAPDALFEAQ